MKLNVSKLCKDAKVMVSKRSPEILTGLGIAGMISTTVLAVRATPKALDLIARAEDKKFDNGHGNKLTVSEKMKVAWKPYIPAAITGIASISMVNAHFYRSRNWRKSMIPPLSRWGVSR